jgi:hypothetical protein
MDLLPNKITTREFIESGHVPHSPEEFTSIINPLTNSGLA